MLTAREVLDVASRLWNYLRGLHFEVDLKALEEKMEELKQRRDVVKKQVRNAEGRGLKRTDEVKEWLNNVAATEKKVDCLIEEGSLLLDRCCCCPCTWCSKEDFIKKLKSRIERVRELQIQGNFSVVAESRNQMAMYDGPTQGLGSILDDVWKALEVDGVGILGLYGMGGVGKTTLLSEIDKKYARTNTQVNTSAHPIVIWVKASNEVDIQNEIIERLQLSGQENSSPRLRAKHIKEALGRISFVLLLDDIREKLDLSAIGVPRTADSNSKSKIVFTTQSEPVCFAMRADKKIRVECLDFDNSWKLFKQIVGEQTLGSHRDIQGLAEKVARKCGGLPLMLILVAQTMATKKTPGAWNHAITQLKYSAANFTRMGVEVFPFSRFSYDELPDETTKACFLFCSLYPEDKSILVEDLFQKWIGQGYISGFTDWKEAFDAGDYIIEVLRETCLLMQFDGYVKMHGVIRELALWISRECDQDKVLVNTGSGVRYALETEKWNKAGIISLTHTEITQLSGEPNCPRLSTLLLFDNVHMKDIDDKFFEHMRALKFLDLSRTKITRLPASIDKLVSLEYLDLSGTRIHDLDCDMKKLTGLKYLFLEHKDEVFKIPKGVEHKDEVFKIPKGVMKGLKKLQMLKLSDSYFGDRPRDKLAGFQDLLGLEELKDLDLKISNGKVLELFFQNREFVRCTRCLFIKPDPTDINLTLELHPPPTPPPPPPQSQVTIVYCLDNNNDEEIGLFRCLETLQIRHLSNFKVSYDVSNRHIFGRLRRVTLSNCDSIVNATWLILVPRLRTLEIDSCRDLTEIVPAGSVVSEETTFLQLETLILKDLPSLRSICAGELLLSSLTKIKVSRCPHLRRLPLGSKNAGNHKLPSIQGTVSWWDNLVWDSNLGCTFSRCFSSIP